MILEAILKINPNAIATVRGDDIDTCQIEWLEGTEAISKEDIKLQFPIIKQELLDLGLTEEEVKALIGV